MRDIPHGQTRQSTHLNTLGVHFVPLVGLRPVETGIALFADEQIREVYLLELQLDRLDELLCYLQSCIGT